MKFELNEYKSILSDEDIIDDIKKVAETLNVDYISISLYKKYGNYSQCAIQNHFGTWKNALKIAGLRVERNSSEYKFISDSMYIDDIKRVASLINRNTVTYDDYIHFGKYSAGHIFKRFGSWDNILLLSGLNPTGLSRKKITEQDLFNEIERIWILLGRQPTSTDIVKGDFSKYSVDTFKRRFGSWRKALEAFVEYINSEENKKHASNYVDDFQAVEIEAQLVSEIQSNDESLNEEVVKNKDIHKTPRNINLKLRFLVMQRDNFKCCACGASPAKDPSVELHIDHIIPWSKGGETVIDNLQTLCSKCNLGKGDLL